VPFIECQVLLCMLKRKARRREIQKKKSKKRTKAAGPENLSKIGIDVYNENDASRLSRAVINVVVVNCPESK
jgi:hypothetical protein